jgi:siroheme synthase (precorrin-2 oxidase/ferrochelatase)
MCCELILPQGLPTSPVTIAVSALQRRENLAKDVKRELSECLQSFRAADSEQNCGDAGMEQDGSGWGSARAEEGCASVDDDMFALDDEPCNVRHAQLRVILFARTLAANHFSVQATQHVYLRHHQQSSRRVCSSATCSRTHFRSAAVHTASFCRLRPSMT